MTKHTTALWWIRRDLRLADNQALAAAESAADIVVPVFVIDPHLMEANRSSIVRVSFLLAGLRQLDRDLQRHGSRLIVRHGKVATALADLAGEAGATAIFAEEDYSPYARRRDAEICRCLPLHLVPGLTVHPPQAVVKADGSPYTVFTPYCRAWKSLPLPGPTRRESLPRLAPPPEVSSLPLPDAAAPEGFPPGEEEAERRLRHFAEGDGAPIYAYDESRDRLDQEGTSGISPYLRFGMVSSRKALSAARRAASEAPSRAAREAAETWINELIWREFYIQVLAHFPFVLRRSFRSGLRHIRWSNDRQAFTAWCEGRTGYPVVDAAMRQLAQTGWMHNRARMIVASFLTKDLLVDWRWGERWFMDHLVDGDPAANNGGWQWTAGVGTDAAPYFRVFNPVLQGKKYDPEGAYVRRWVAELARVPRQYVHEPWLMPFDVQRDSGCVIGSVYPPPLVDHSQMRSRALAAYRASLEVKG